MQRFGFTLAVMLAVGACGGSDHTNGQTPNNPGSQTDAGANVGSDSGNTGPGCGDHVCTVASETCATCAADCGCASGNSCTGAGTTATCRTTNPLIAALPGTWAMVMANDRPINDPSHVYEMTVDPADPRCMHNGQPQGDPGDACVHGLSPYGGLVLTDDRLQAHAIDNSRHASGQVLNGGRRIELTDTWAEEVTRFVYTRR